MSFDKIIPVKVKDIEISPQNVRRTNATQDLDELAASIEKYGLLEPVILRGNSNDPPPFQLIAGQRRLLAHEKLGKDTIRAVFTGKIKDQEATILSLIENLQSVDLNHADTAKAITALYKKANNNEREVVRETGLSLRKIRDYISIEAQASPKMKSQLRQNKVSPTDVKRALRAAQGNLKKAEQLLELMEQYQLTKHQKRRIVEFSETNPKATAKKIIEEARRPKVEQSILVSLPEDVRKGLERATKNLSKEPEEIVADILHDWLANQGFIGA